MTLHLIVVDTSVVVSGLVTSDRNAPTARILDAMLRRSFNFLLSSELLAEYRAVLLRPKIVERHGLTEEEVDRVLTEIATSAIVRDTPVSDERSPDPGDQHLWALLATEEASVLVTGDRALLENPPRARRVVSPRAFVTLLDSL